MKKGNLKIERALSGEVKVARLWNGSDTEDWQVYLSQEEWNLIVKELALPSEDEKPVVPAEADTIVMKKKVK